MIDIHCHVGKLYFDPFIDPELVLSWMDKYDVRKAALHPIENPEETAYYVTTWYILEVCRQHPDRFIPFMNVDPRRLQTDASVPFHRIIEEYKDLGCKGFGECMSGLYADDPRLQSIYEACGELEIPIIFHQDYLRTRDEVGLPRFEKMIRKFKKTIFCGHGPGFWANISGDLEPGAYGFPNPQQKTDGPVVEGGAVPRLLEEYPNAYADISAGSGYNALTREPEYGYEFLERFQDKLFFGTDICHTSQIEDDKIPHATYLRDALAAGKISQQCFDKIAEENAIRVFDLE